MSDISDTPAAEPAEEAKVEAKPESPAGTLREQLLQLVPDDQKSQAADLIRALIEHAPAPASSEASKDESPIVAKRYEHLPFRPRVTREEPKKEGANYGSISDE